MTNDVWDLDPDVTFLNHGAYGACPQAVLAAQSRLRARLEREPVRFFLRDFEPLLDESRNVLVEFLHAEPEDLAFVTSATEGVNAVLRSLQFRSEDELLVTDQAYNACRNALNFVGERSGARIVVASLPFPLGSTEEVVSRLLEKVTARTRLALIDHVTSPTGLVLPIERIVREMNSRGIETLIDGAHAPGMVEVNLMSLGATYYAGNGHKWLCAPKGAGFLWVRRDRQGEIVPAVVSHGLNSARTDRSRFQLLFDWTGTHDPTPHLCVGEAIRYLGGLLPGGWPEIRERNRALALAGRRLLCAELDLPEPAPEEMIGSLASVPLPDRREAMRPPLSTLDEIDPVQEALWQRYCIEVPIIPWPAPPQRLVRISAQLYNRREQYERLAAALGECL